MSLNPVIIANNLQKNFNGFQAVQSINFKINPAECYGFLGPNGAGKTSTMRMIYCFSPPSGGELRVMGHSVLRATRQIKAVLGVVPQDDNLDPDLTVEQNLLLFSTYFDIQGSEAKQRTQELLEFFSLQEKQNKKINQLSGGMCRRLLIARALINRPQILILDEPTTGLDPQGRHLIWHRLRKLKESGVTMVLTTHYMEEAAQLCDRLAMMNHGQILAEDTPDALIKKYAGEEVLEVRANESKLKALQNKISKEMRVPKFDDGVETTAILAGTLYIRLKEKNVKLLEYFPEIQSLEFYHRPATLEDVFLNLSGKGLSA